MGCLSFQKTYVQQLSDFDIQSVFFCEVYLAYASSELYKFIICDNYHQYELIFYSIRLEVLWTYLFGEEL